MRILLLPELFPSSQQPDAGVFMNDQMRALQTIGEVMVFNSNPWYRGEYEQQPAAKYFDLHLYSKKPPSALRIPAYRWWEMQSFRMGLRLPKPDIIHLHGAALRGRWALMLAAKWKVPLVVTEHTGPWSAISSRKLLLRRVKHTLENADCVLPVSHHLAEEIANSGIAPRSMEVLPNPVDTDFFSLRKNPLDQEKLILFIGRLDAFKGALRTLQAFHGALHSLSDYSLLIAGEGEEAGPVADYIAQHGLEQRVRLEQGFFSRAQMRVFFHRASFLVYPSRFESFGLVGAEAMATGLPVIITNTTGPRDYFIPAAGIAVPPDAVNEIGQAMQHLAGTLTRYNPAAIRDHMVSLFSTERYAARLGEVYGQVCTR